MLLRRVSSRSRGMSCDAYASLSPGHFWCSALHTPSCLEAFALADPLSLRVSASRFSEGWLLLLEVLTPLAYPLSYYVVLLSSKWLRLWGFSCLFICSLCFHLSAPTRILAPGEKGACQSYLPGNFQHREEGANTPKWWTHCSAHGFNLVTGGGGGGGGSARKCGWGPHPLKCHCSKRLRNSQHVLLMLCSVFQPGVYSSIKESNCYDSRVRLIKK